MSFATLFQRPPISPNTILDSLKSTLSHSRHVSTSTTYNSLYLGPNPNLVHGPGWITQEVSPRYRYHPLLTATTSNSKAKRPCLLPAAYRCNQRVKSFHISSQFCSQQVEEKGRSNVTIELNPSSPWLTISLEDSKAMEIPLLWLRDHCHCPKCFNHSTLQRKVDKDLLQRDLNPRKVTYDQARSSLAIEWKDDHSSTYEMKDLKDMFFPGTYSHRNHFLWDKARLTAQDIPSVAFDEHMNSEAGLIQTVSNLVKFGFTFVDETPVSIDATQQVAEKVGKVMPTLYGGMWTLSSGSQDYQDTAYTNIPLGAHTDLTYYTAGAGIQIFHGMKHTGKGGETLLVDGFQAANVLREKYPESFDCLTSCIIPHQYREPISDKSPGYHIYNLCHVISTHPNSGELIQIRYNPYDRAPLNTLKPNQLQDFYIAYQRLSTIIQDPANEFWIRLTPGRVLFIDNWRVMHGRAAFTGLRILCGCYLQRDEWISKARVFNVF